MLKDLIYDLTHFTMFKWIWGNIQELGFFKWFLIEFNNSWYKTRSFRWSGFLKVWFNFLIGHPFLGFGISSIAVLVFGWESGTWLVLGIVIGEEIRQMLFGMKAKVWYPIDALADISTWMAGAFLFNLINPM